MDVSFLETRISKLLAEATRLEISVGLHYMDVDNSEWEATEDEIDANNEKEAELIEPFRYLISALYESVLCYLDSKKLEHYLELFFEKFGKPFDFNKATEKFNYHFYYSDEPHNVFLSSMRNFLSVFEFADDAASIYMRSSGIKYLENILNSTAFIVGKCTPKPTSEPDVYKAVKDVLHYIFPNAKEATSNFCKVAQEYKPDILIPELKVAVEYKYANTEAKLKKTIDDIHADVKGYTDDSDYEIFYAVFYVVGKIWTQEKFDQVWKEKMFPNNWKPIYKID